jgi:NDP-sugar pyrophosphorylase family protein
VIPAIILAGGSGTRLASAVSDVPKPMAPIGARPFLELVMTHLRSQGVAELVLSIGHKGAVIERHFGARWQGVRIRYCAERAPLGTGGAMRKAMDEGGYAQAFVLNGDTYCPVALAALAAAQRGAHLTLTLKKVDDAARFGSVQMAGDGRITGFREKNAAAGPGLINAGVYLVQRELFEFAPRTPRFSFETEVLQKAFGAATMRGYVTDAMFIDIGIPSEWRRAQELLA